MSDEAMHGRVTVLETAVQKLETQVEKGFAEVSKSISKISDAVSAHRQPVPLKEILLTIGACLGVFSYAGNFLEGQYRKNVAPIEQRIHALEKKTDTIGSVLGRIVVPLAPKE